MDPESSTPDPRLDETSQPPSATTPPVPTKAPDQIAAAERWFLEHGLPYFIDGEGAKAQAAMRPRRLWSVTVTAAVIAIVAGIAVGLLAGDVGLGILTALVITGAIAVAYAASALNMTPMAKWAGKRTFASLGLLFPLITRALPLLLVFATFFFINAEAWQVTASLPRGALYIVVLFFFGLAVAFLLVRLPEEVARVRHEAAGDRVVQACKGTPLEAAAAQVGGRVPDAPLSTVQRTNLLIVLLVAQMIQVLLLSFAVFVFFVVFGLVAIRPEIVESWTGMPPVFLGWDAGGFPIPVSNQLFAVSIFLAAFSGLYFTVYAVSDETYRQQFFTLIVRELERAVGVRAVYAWLRGDSAADPVHRSTDTQSPHRG